MWFFSISLITFLTVSHFLIKLAKQFVSREILVDQHIVPPDPFPMVSVIIPARNEEKNIEKCIRSLMAQTYDRQRYEIIAVDDGSSDNTLKIIKKLKKEGVNLTVTQARALPDGWTGKNNACYCGAALAQGQWFCFIDADTFAEPDLLKKTIAYAMDRQIDLLSINPSQQMISLSELIVLPGIFLSIASRMDFKKSNDPKSEEAIANGQFMLFNRETYNGLGGHCAVRHHVMEDLTFARLVKKSGRRVFWGFGDRLIHTRMYRDGRDIWQGFSKNLCGIVNVSSLPGAAATLLQGGILGWAPLVMTMVSVAGFQPSDPFSVAAGLLNSMSFLAMTIFGVMSIKAFHIPLIYACTLPVGFTMYGIITLNSFLQKKRGTRTWKQRTYR